jgi:hypothetical protein
VEPRAGEPKIVVDVIGLIPEHAGVVVEHGILLAGRERRDRDLLGRLPFDVALESLSV